MPNISDLIARRSDLSTFVVHLTRSSQASSALENLQSIVDRRVIEARSAFGSAVRPVRTAILRGRANQRDLDSQNVVAFTETPLEHLHLMLAQIDDLNRNFRFEPYGIAMTKSVARNNGVNPVWYLDITPGHDWLTVPLNTLINRAIETGDFANSDIASLTPFIEQMGSGEGYRKEFWWEREWRHTGNFTLPPRIIIIAPKDEHEQFDDNPFHYQCIDARWGLEEIIARLAGFGPADVGPF